MMIIQQTKRIYNELPAGVRLFALRGLLLLTSWLVIYHYYMIPNHILDPWLTAVVENHTARILSLFYTDAHVVGDMLYTGNTYMITIRDGCNGLELFVLFIGFMLCVPTTIKRFWAFTIAGSIVIHIANLVRCAALAVMNMHHSYLTDFAHHYAFKLILYAVIFFMWLLYVKKEKKHEAES